MGSDRKRIIPQFDRYVFRDFDPIWMKMMIDDEIMLDWWNVIVLRMQICWILSIEKWLHELVK